MLIQPKMLVSFLHLEFIALKNCAQYSDVQKFEITNKTLLTIPSLD